MRSIDILWTPPNRLAYLDSLEEAGRDRLYGVFRRDAGVHEVLYIGQTARSTADRLADRRHPIHRVLADHAGTRWDIVVRVGEVALGPNRRLTRKLLDEVEAALIFFHDPRYNVRHTSSYSSRDMAIRNLTRGGARSVLGLEARVTA